MSGTREPLLMPKGGAAPPLTCWHAVSEAHSSGSRQEFPLGVSAQVATDTPTPYGYVSGPSRGTAPHPRVRGDAATVSACPTIAYTCLLGKP